MDSLVDDDEDFHQKVDSTLWSLHTKQRERVLTAIYAEQIIKTNAIICLDSSLISKVPWFLIADRGH